MLIGSEPGGGLLRVLQPERELVRRRRGRRRCCRVRATAPGSRSTGSWCSPGLETSWNGSWRVSAAGGTALWDGDYAPVAETADGEQIPAEPGTEPEQIAGSLAEFVDRVCAPAPRRRARRTATSQPGHGRGARSDRPRPGGGWSSATCSTMPIARRSRTSSDPNWRRRWRPGRPCTR